MSRNEIRLRLVVRRNGLPEVKVAWPMSLENEPTIAKLLEQVNEIIPLESGEWGLEDYAVELRSSDGSNFECLHFQSVRSVLKEDDQVFIRALLSDDLRRHRVTGRRQISSDGKRLIDGIAFGRPLIKAPRGRPPLDIPPRKRRRITFDDEDLHEPEEGETFDQYEDRSMLLLTNGEENHGRRRSVRIQTDFEDADIDGQADDKDEEFEDDNEPQNDGEATDADEDDDFENDGMEDDASEQDDLEQELRDLQNDNMQDDPADEDVMDGEAEGLPDDDMEDDAGETEEEDDVTEEEDTEQSLQKDDDMADDVAKKGRLEQELQGLQQDLQNDAMEDDMLEQDRMEHEFQNQCNGAASSPANSMSQSLTLEALDKLSALRAAFPSAPMEACNRILEMVDRDLKKAYVTLAECFPAELSKEDMLSWPKKASNGSSLASGASQPKDAPPSQAEQVTSTPQVTGMSSEHESEDEDPDDVSPFVRRFDRQGLPPGSITSGRGLHAMASFASSKLSGASEATSTTLANNKPNAKAAIIDDDTTSSSGTSSSSESDSDEDDSDEENDEEEDEVPRSDDSEDDSSEDDDDDGSGNGSGSGAERSNRGHDTSFDTDEENEHDSSDSENDSGPEETSAKNGATKHDTNALGAPNSSSGESSSGSSDESDADDETSASDDSSEEDSSDDESSSESESESVKNTIPNTQQMMPETSTTQSHVEKISSLSKSSSAPQPTTVPPGAGKTATRKRNERRRAALKSKQQAAQKQTPDETLDANSALFEAKRKALLDAIANGGIEIGSGGEFHMEPQSNTPQGSQKRKREELDTSEGAADKTSNESLEAEKSQAEKPEAEKSEAEKPEAGKPEAGKPEAQTLEAKTPESPTTGPKRRRVDIGVGRRMLFGALGVKNPKTKEDEDILRNKLMEDVRPLVNARLEGEAGKTKVDAEKTELVDDDPDAWRRKIIYRAVECCHEGVKLSEPPFPFIQRWDPQQQGSWFHKGGKRGGRGKRAQRNQSHFYQQSGGSGKKRKYDDSFNRDDEECDATFDDTRENPIDTDVILNYDDVDPQPGGDESGAGVSQFTDADDLPSVPEDLSSLPPLRPGEVLNGMVITWKQFVLSKATNWQPELLNLTGVIVRVDDDATGLQVLLAKRDRHLDRNEKEYNNATGQRVYGRFEAPEDDEEEDEAEAQGYRTLNFADIMDPKILQQPIPLEAPKDEEAAPTIPSIEHDFETTEPTESVVFKDTTFEGFDDEPNAGNPLDVTVETTVGTGPPVDITEPATAEHSEKTVGTSNSTEGQLGQVQEVIDPSLDPQSQISSPSRQLHNETASIAVEEFSEDEATANVSSDNDVSAISETAPDSAVPEFEQSHEEVNTQVFDEDPDVITGTPKATYPKLTERPSSASSVRSGRQPDFSMDIDMTEPDSFRQTDEAEDEDNGNTLVEESVIIGERSTMENHDHQKSPTPTSARPSSAFDSPGQKIKDSPKLKATPEAAKPQPSSPYSLSSLNTVWCTAVTTRNIQTPSKSQTLAAKNSQKSRVSKEKDEYQEAMHKLDDFSGDDMGEESRISDSFKHFKQERLDDAMPSSPDPFADSPESDRFSSLPPRSSRPVAKISPPPTSRGKRKLSVSAVSPPPKQKSPPRLTRRTSSQPQSSIPPGTEVFVISSDSDEAVRYTESYADEDVDGTYDPAKSSSSLPHGSSWVSKKPRGRAPRAASLGSSQANRYAKMKQESAAAVLKKKIGKGRKTSQSFPV